MGQRPYTRRGKLVTAMIFFLTALLHTPLYAQGASNFRIAAIIIDPGHGGRDPGAVSEHVINGRRQRIQEKDITLNASIMLRDMLARTYPGRRILMTREHDVMTSLEERSGIANAIPSGRNEAVIFISIHTNFASNQNIRGFEVWYLNPEYRRTVLDESEFSDSPELRSIMNLLAEEVFTVESIRLAQSMLDSLSAAMGNSIPSRGIKAEEFFVVRHSHMPAVLVELGFISNRDDAILMTSDAGLRRMVDAIHKGIVDFVTAFER